MNEVDRALFKRKERAETQLNERRKHPPQKNRPRADTRAFTRSTGAHVPTISARHHNVRDLFTYRLGGETPAQLWNNHGLPSWVYKDRHVEIARIAPERTIIPAIFHFLVTFCARDNACAASRTRGFCTCFCLQFFHFQSPKTRLIDGGSRPRRLRACMPA